MMREEDNDLTGYTSDMISLLSCLLMDTTIIDSLRVRPDMLLRRNGEIVLSVILEQHRNGIKPDHVTIHDALSKRGQEFSDSRTWAAANINGWQMPSSVNWEHYESSLIDSWIKHKILLVSRMIVEEAYKPSISASDLISWLEETQTQVAQIDDKDSIRTIGQVLDPVFDILQERKRLGGDLPGIRTGFSELDEKTLGMQKGQLWIIGARPSQGKSALMGEIHRYAALHQDKKVGVITIESSAEELAIRSLAAEGPVNAKALATGQYTAADLTSIKNAVTRLKAKDKKMLYYDKSTMSLSQLRSVSRRLVIKHGVDVIFLDYLQRIRVPKQKSRTDEVTLATIECKEIARELNIPFVALAQLGRDADEKKPGLGDFQHSSQIEQDADVAILIWHQKYFEEVEKGEGLTKKKYKVEKKQSWFLVEKCRDGATGDIKVKFEKEHLTFKEQSNDSRYE